MSLLEASLMFWMFPQTLKALDVGGQIQASENRPPPQSLAVCCSSDAGNVDRRHVTSSSLRLLQGSGEENMLVTLKWGGGGVFSWWGLMAVCAGVIV